MNLRTQVVIPANEFQGKVGSQVRTIEPSKETRHMLTRQYRDYVELVTGKAVGRLGIPGEWDERGREGLGYYTTQYLPYEIISWGGDVRVPFPLTYQLLDHHGLSLNQFVEFWFAHSRTSESKYDFFLLKIHLFVKFLGQVLPCAVSTVEKEAEHLSQGYRVACQGSRT